MILLLDRFTHPNRRNWPNNKNLNKKIFSPYISLLIILQLKLLPKAGRWAGFMSPSGSLLDFQIKKESIRMNWEGNQKSRGQFFYKNRRLFLIFMMNFELESVFDCIPG